MGRTCVMIIWVCTAATAARADFVIRNDAGSPPEATPVRGPSPAESAANGIPAPPRPPPAPRFKVAYGFGDQVPLGFACRQIVPPAVRVTYGPGATPDQLVSWKGGDTWNHVLRDAVTPLGLRLLMTQTAVEIRR